MHLDGAPMTVTTHYTHGPRGPSCPHTPHTRPTRLHQLVSNLRVPFLDCIVPGRFAVLLSCDPLRYTKQKKTKELVDSRTPKYNKCEHTGCEH